jgi:hypothetical protein
VASKVAEPSLLFDWPCWPDQHAVLSVPSVAVPLPMAGPWVVLLVALVVVALLVVQAAPGLLMEVGPLAALVPVLGKLVVLGPAAAVILVVAFVAGPTKTLLKCFC